jgi:hypothetical protein
MSSPSIALRCSLLAVSFALFACGKEMPSSPPPPAASVAPPALHLGEPISLPVVALSDIAARPADYRGKALATTGVVTAVCQEMGCWMEIKDAAGVAHIRMHGHSFFVPKTAAGHLARVQATVVPAKGGNEECDDEAAQQMGHRTAKLELDATGVELE